MNTLNLSFKFLLSSSILSIGHCFKGSHSLKCLSCHFFSRKKFPTNLLEKPFALLIIRIDVVLKNTEIRTLVPIWG